jgi:hypothetical protein
MLAATLPPILAAFAAGISLASLAADARRFSSTLRQLIKETDDHASVR